MQLKTIGESLTVLNSIQGIMNNTTLTSRQQNRLLKEAVREYSLETVKAAIAQSTLNETQITAILSEKGLRGETLKTTSAELAQITTTNALASSQEGAMASTLGLSTAMKGLWASTTKVFTGMLKFVKSNPYLIVIGAVVGALTYAVTAEKRHQKAIEEKAEALEETKSEYESVKSELEDINSELESNAQKIDELNAKDNLTYVEKGELEKLQKATEELKLQQKIKEDEAKRKADEVAKDSKDSYDEQFGDYGNVKESIDEYKQLYDDYGSKTKMSLSKDENDIAGQIVALEEYKKMYNEALANNDADLAQSYFDAMDEIETTLRERISDLNSQQEGLQSNYDTAKEKEKNGEVLTTNEKETIQYYNQIYESLKTIYSYIDQNAWNEINFEGIFDIEGIEKTKEELIELEKQGELTPVLIKSFPNLNKGLEDVGISVYDFIQQLRALANEANNTSEVVEGIAPKKSFNELWDYLSAGNFSEEEEELEELQEKLLELASTGQLTKETFEEADSTGYFDSLNVSVLEAVDNINKLVSSSDQLNAMDSQISKMSELLGKRKSGEVVTSDDLSGFGDEIKGLDTWTKYQETLGDTTSTISEVRKATNALATEFVNSNNFLSQLNEENQLYYETQLKEMGVENAHQVVQKALAISTANLAAEKEFLSETSKKVEDATYEEIEGYIQNSKFTEENREYIARLALEKVLANGTLLNFEGDISALINFQKTIGGSTTALQELQKVKQMISSGETITGGKTFQEQQITQQHYQSVANKSEKDIEDGIKKQKKKTKINTTITPTYNKTGSNGSSTKNKNSDTAQIFDFIEKRLNKLADVADKSKNKIEDMLNLKSKQNQTKKAINAVNKEITANIKAARLYQKYANKVGRKGIDEKTFNKYKKLVESGSLNSKSIASIKNEKLKTAITEYQTYYDKVKSCKDAVISLNDELKDLYETMAQNIVDKASEKVEKYNNATSLLEKKRDNITVNDYKKSVSNSNKLISYSDKTVSAYEDAETSLSKGVKKANANTKKATKNINKILPKKNKAKDVLTKAEVKKLKAIIKAKKKVIPDNMLSKIKNASLLKYCENYNDSILQKNAYKDLLTDVTQDKEEAKQDAIAQKREQQKDNFDRIQTYYENQSSLIQAKQDSLSSQIDLIEAKSATVDKKLYEDQIVYEQEKMALYQKEKAELETQLGNIEQGTQEWYDANQSIADVDSNIASCTNSVIEMHQAINDLADTAREKLLGTFDTISEEADFLANLMSNKDMFNVQTGAITDEGLATLGTYSIGYNINKLKANDTKALIESFKNAVAGEDGVYRFTDALGESRIIDSTEAMQDKIKELYSDWRDEISSTYEYETKIIDMMKEKYENELDALKELIDLKKDALDSEKELYEYQKSISEKSNNIDSLQKQIAAITGDTSEQGMAETQRLKAQLEEAQKDLQDTEYDKYISDQQDILDKLYDEYESLLKEEMQDTDLLLKKGIKAVEDNINAIDETYKDYAEKYGYTYQELGNLINNSTIDNIKSGVTTIGNTLNDIYTHLTKPNDEMSNSSSNDTATNNADDNGGNNPGDVANTNTPTTPTTPTTSTADLANDYVNKLADEIEKNVYSLNEKGVVSDVDAVKSVKKGLRILGYGDLNISSSTWGKEFESAIATFKKDAGLKSTSGTNFGKTFAKALANKLRKSAYANGGIAETINRITIANGDDGIATIQRGEAVFTKAQTKTFTQDFIPAMNDMIKASKTIANMPNNLNSSNTNNINANYTFNLEKCINADDIIRQVRDNKTVQNVLMDATVNKAMSGSRLGTSKYRC